MWSSLCSPHYNIFFSLMEEFEEWQQNTAIISQQHCEHGNLQGVNIVNIWINKKRNVWDGAFCSSITLHLLRDPGVLVNQRQLQQGPGIRKEEKDLWTWQLWKYSVPYRWFLTHLPRPVPSFPVPKAAHADTEGSQLKEARSPQTSTDKGKHLKGKRSSPGARRPRGARQGPEGSLP